MPGKVAFLDRDGVINDLISEDGEYRPPFNTSEIRIIPGVETAVQLLKKLGYIPVVVTNQPDIARGKITLDQVKNINKHISSLTGIKYFYVCPHDDIDNCLCRKPKSGLLRSAIFELELDISGSFLVGDRWKDIQAGQDLGINCFFIDYQRGCRQPLEPYVRVNSLLSVLEFLEKEI